MATVIFIIHMALDMQYSIYIYRYIYIHKIIHIYIYICIHLFPYVMCLVMRFISERYHCNLIVSDSVYFVSRGGSPLLLQPSQ